MAYRPYPNSDRALRHVTRQREASAWHPDFAFNLETNELTKWAQQMRRFGDELGRAGAAALAHAASQRPTGIV